MFKTLCMEGMIVSKQHVFWGTLVIVSYDATRECFIDTTDITEQFYAIASKSDIVK